MRNGIMIVTVAALILAAVPSEANKDDGWTLKTVLKEMDRAGKGFKSATAEVNVEVEGKDGGGEVGKVAIDQGHKLRYDVTEPEERTVWVIGGAADTYKPGDNTVRHTTLAKTPTFLEQYMMLGFVETGSALQSTYLLTLVGENEADGKKVMVVELTPKTDKLRGAISKIQLWMDQATWLPVRQDVYTGGPGVFYSILYTNLSRNPKIDGKTFKPEWPKGTQKIK